MITDLYRWCYCNCWKGKAAFTLDPLPQCKTMDDDVAPCIVLYVVKYLRENYSFCLERSGKM